MSHDLWGGDPTATFGETVREAGDRLEVAPLGAHLLKGRTEPTNAFELVAVRA
jgi:hypothetical protein